MSPIRSFPLALLFAAAPLWGQDPASEAEKSRAQAPQDRQQSDAKPLRLVFEAGKVAYYRTTRDTSGGGGSRAPRAHIEMFTRLRVAKVENGVATLEQTITRAKADMATPFGNVSYDSADADSDPGVLHEFADMVGETVVVRVDATGKVLGVEAPKAMQRHGAASMEQMIKQSIPTMPNEPVAVGGTWQTDLELPLGPGMTARIVIVSKLLERGDKTATLEQTMQVDDEDLEDEQMAIEITKVTGTSKIDLTTGMPSDMDKTIELKASRGEESQSVKLHLTMKELSESDAAAAKAAGEKAPASSGEGSGGGTGEGEGKTGGGK